MKNPILLLMLFYSSLCCAQTKLHGELNKYRVDDKLVKIRILYKDCGRNGSNVLWNLGEVDEIDRHYELRYTSDNGFGDSCIVGIENNTMYYYNVSDSSIVMTGFENNTTKITYDVPEVVMSFPMSYGDSISGYFHGTGTYCDKVAMRSFGNYRTVADGFGLMVLPDGDTIRNVLRIHTMKKVYGELYHIDSLKSVSAVSYSVDKIREHIEQADMITESDIYRWYAPGYRYPVLETFKVHAGINDGGDCFTASFYYPLSEQNSLPYDIENKKERERFILQGGDMFNPLHDDTGFIYNTYISDNGLLRFEYSMSSSADVSYDIFTPSGMSVYSSGVKRLRQGAYEDLFCLSGYSRGVYLLKIRVNDNQYSEKILLR